MLKITKPVCNGAARPLHQAPVLVFEIPNAISLAVIFKEVTFYNREEKRHPVNNNAPGL